MKTFLIPLCLLCLTGAIRVETVVAEEQPGPELLDKQYGFRDLKFGTKLDKLNGLKFSKAHKLTPRIKYYTRQKDALEAYGTKIDEITYGFIDDVLFEVVLRDESKGNEPRLQQALSRFCETYDGSIEEEPGPCEVWLNCWVEGERATAWGRYTFCSGDKTETELFIRIHEDRLYAKAVKIRRQAGH